MYLTHTLDFYMNPVYFFSALIIIVVWGLNIVVGKLGVLSIPPILLVSMRATLVAMLLSPFLKKLPDRKSLFGIIILVFGVLQFVCLFVGLTGVDGGVAAIALQTLVPFGVILARIKFGERMSFLQILGLSAAFAGVVVIAGEPQVVSRPEYLGIVVAGAFCMALGSVLIKDLGPINVFRLHGWLALGSAPLLLLASFVLEDNQFGALMKAGWTSWGAIVFTAVATTIIGHGLWAYLLQKLPVYKVMPINLLVAVAGVVFSTIILHEPLTVEIFIGGTMTLTGVAMIQLVRT
jgi:O-acetylserine/cysteine efflux transporter